MNRDWVIVTGQFLRFRLGFQMRFDWGICGAWEADGPEVNG